MKVLIACEFSGIVREAFRKRGHDAWSCDLLPTEIAGKHFQDDVINVIGEKHDYWDLMIAHPPCTYLTVTGNRWMKSEYQKLYPNRTANRKEAIAFFMKLVNAPIAKIAIENPIGIMSTHYRRPDQIIQPWMFGDPFQKSTCLWLKNLPPLQHAKEDDLFFKKTHTEHGEFIPMPSGKRLPKWYSDNKNPKERSRTFQGIANAMAAQWG